MGMQPPAPPPGASDDPGWRRDESAYGRPPPTDRPTAPPPGYGPPPGWGAGPADAGTPPPGYRPYGQPAYGAYGAQTDHPQGTTILVLGILSLVVCGLLGPVAWVMGSNTLKEIDADPTRYRNRGNVVAGKVLGIISSVLLIVTVFAWIAIIGIIVGANN